MDEVSALQIGSALLLDVGFIWLVGTWFARRWLYSSGVGANACEAALRRGDLAAAGLSAAGSFVALYAATAVMAGIGLREAGSMFWMMLSATDYGHAGCIAIAAMIVLFGIRLRGGTGGMSDAASGLTMAVFAVTRASMGHAGEEGFWSVALAVESVHFIGIGIWAGAVFVSAYFVLSPARVAGVLTDRYLERMSRAALWAVVAIVVSGTYNAWHRVGSIDGLTNSYYGTTLLIKMAFVVGAIGLGAYNKFFGLPAATRSARGVAMVRRVLRAESVLLLGALAAAAILGSQQAPGAM